MALSRSVVSGLATGISLALDSSTLASASDPPADIVNGTPTTGFPAVAALIDQELICTAFLIRPDCVLTAAHCGDANTLPPGSLVYFGSDAGSGQSTFLTEIGDVAVNPDWNPDNPPAHDVAVVALAEPTFIQPFALDSPGDNMTSVTIVGFGSTGMTIDGKKRTADVLQIAKTTTTITTDGTVSNTCSGDSGSPLLRDFGGGLKKAVGIASAGDIGCVQLALWERIDSDLACIGAAIDSLCHGVFLDNFETEGTSAWSGTAP